MPRLAVWSQSRDQGTHPSHRFYFHRKEPSCALVSSWVGSRSAGYETTVVPPRLSTASWWLSSPLSSFSRSPHSARTSTVSSTRPPPVFDGAGRLHSLSLIHISELTRR